VAAESHGLAPTVPVEYAGGAPSSGRQGQPHLNLAARCTEINHAFVGAFEKRTSTVDPRSPAFRSPLEVAERLRHNDQLRRSSVDAAQNIIEIGAERVLGELGTVEPEPPVKEGRVALLIVLPEVRV
jgi:hypothetical protein